MKTRSIAFPLAAITTLVLAACGGGGGSSSSGGTTTTTTQAASLSGVVQGKGSLVINGIRCSTTGARISDDDGNTYSNDDVQIGYVVTSDCEYDDASKAGRSSNVIVKREFAGPVDTVSSDRFTLLGQTILVTATTLFSGDNGASASSLADIASGNFVEVYGLPKSDGTIEATHVEKNGSVSGLQSGVEGRGDVSNVDNTAKTFQIGNLTVNYSAAPNAGTITLQDGQLVRFKSTNQPVYTGGGNATLAATTIQTRSVRSEYDPNNDGRAEIKGYVESDAGDADANTFVVNGVLIDISNLSSSGKSLFTTGALLEVKGVFNGDTLVASKAERENDRVSRSGGRIEFYGVASNGSFSNGTLSFNIQNYQVTFNRDACGIGGGATPYVEVKGNLSNGVIAATKVECEDSRSASSSSDDSDREFSGNRFEVSGTVANFDSAAREFTIRDLTVRITDTTRFDDGASEARMQNGRRVEVKGALDGNSVMIAEKIEFEDR